MVPACQRSRRRHLIITVPQERQIPMLLAFTSFPPILSRLSDEKLGNRVALSCECRSCQVSFDLVQARKAKFTLPFRSSSAEEPNQGQVLYEHILKQQSNLLVSVVDDKLFFNVHKHTTEAYTLSCPPVTFYLSGTWRDFDFYVGNCIKMADQAQKWSPLFNTRTPP